MVQIAKQNITADKIEYAHKTKWRAYEMDAKKYVEEEEEYFELVIDKKEKVCRYSYVNYRDGVAHKGEKDLAEVGWELMEALYRDLVFGTMEDFNFQEVIQHLFINPIYE